MPTTEFYEGDCGSEPLDATLIQKAQSSFGKCWVRRDIENVRNTNDRFLPSGPSREGR